MKYSGLTEEIKFYVAQNAYSKDPVSWTVFLRMAYGNMSVSTA